MDLTLKSRRKLWLKVHLYLGLFAGAVFVLAGLTGSLLAFESPLDEWLNLKLMTVPVDKENNRYLPLDTIVASGLKALPLPTAKQAPLAFPGIPDWLLNYGLSSLLRMRIALKAINCLSIPIPERSLDNALKLIFNAAGEVR